MKKAHWKDYFYFTKTERNGILVLLVLVILSLVIPPFFSRFFSSPPSDFSHLETQVQTLLKAPLPKATAPIDSLNPNPQRFPFDPNLASEAALLQLGLSSKTTRTLLNYRKKGGRFFRPQDLQKVYGLSQQDYQQLLPYIKIKNTATSTASSTFKKTTPAPKDSLPPVVLRPFDPNLATKSELMALGIPAKASQTILNFRNKGGSFRRKEDLQKIFGITAALYQNLTDYIDIPPKAATSPWIKKDSSKTIVQAPPVIIDVNQASTEDWQKLRGIGPYFAEKIVQWREQLGGFSNLEQIQATYNFPDSTYQQIKSQLRLSPLRQQLKINRAPLRVLQKHPYISYRQAQVIINYRNNHGAFSSWEDFIKVKVFSPPQLERLKPYLAWE